MQAYRWHDPKTVMRYGAKLAAKNGASARLAMRFSAAQQRGCCLWSGGVG
ncbi:hypothetical protein [Sphingobium yanoikuyae]|jgi:hypothetical protein